MSLDLTVSINIKSRFFLVFFLISYLRLFYATSQNGTKKRLHNEDK